MTQLSSLKLTVEHTQLEKQHWEERWRSAQVPPLPPPPPLPLALLACSYSVFVAFLWLVLSLLCFPRPPPLPNFLISLFCACSSTFPPPDRPCFAFFFGIVMAELSIQITNVQVERNGRQLEKTEEKIWYETFWFDKNKVDVLKWSSLLLIVSPFLSLFMTVCMDNVNQYDCDVYVFNWNTTQIR